MMPAPEFKVVASSQIEMVAYDAESKTLFIVFKGGAIYRYIAVPSSIFEGLMSAKSLGSFFGEHIKGKDRANPIYRYEKIGSGKAEFEAWWRRQCELKEEVADLPGGMQ